MLPIKVLLADGNASFTRTTKAFLEQIFFGESGLRVLDPVSSGLEMLARIGLERPDLILMDLDMPDMSGSDAIKGIKTRPGSPEIVIMSFCEVAELRVVAAHAGAHGYLDKSDLVERLPLLIQARLDRRVQ